MRKKTNIVTTKNILAIIFFRCLQIFNKTIVYITLRPRFCILASHLEYQQDLYALAAMHHMAHRLMGKHDVIHKTGST